MHRTQNPTAPAADTDNPAVVTPADVLRGAANYLQAHGWVQHVYYGGTAKDAFPPACADGAIGMAAYGHTTGCPGRAKENPGYRDYNRARDHFEGYLAQTGYRPPCDPWCPGDNDCLCDNGSAEIVFLWNDGEQVIKEDILRALNAAADDYDWQHATEDDLETYADICAWREENPDRDGFLAWLSAR